MENMKFRKDNKKFLLWVYAIFILAIITSLIINVLNTKKVLNMYIIAGVFGVLILSYLILYPIIIKTNKKPLQLEDNYLAFYVSFNKHNKGLKRIMILIDLIELLAIVGVATYYIVEMKMSEVYGIYSLIVMLVLVALNAFILIKDIIKLNSLDRIDAHTGSHQLSIIDKKILFALNMLAIALANIGMLSVTKPHFVIKFYDMVTFEFLSTLMLLISLSSIFINKIYYLSFDIKQIEQTEFNTRYLEFIGQGKYAKVYKAYMSSLDTVYAVKKLESKDVSDIERFKAEFNIMKALNHNNLLRVYSFDELHYEYTMDYCKYSLYDYVKNHKLSEKEKQTLINQLLSAFDYLHNHGIMHRDVSYFNVMIYESGSHEITLKVMDFGIAKNARENKTRRGTEIRGTLIDPALKEFNKYNEQNDIYGIGSIINYIESGDEAITYDGSKIANIVAKCMDINLANRYHHVSEIIDAYKEATL